jgi:hypothetical protein
MSKKKRIGCPEYNKEVDSLDWGLRNLVLPPTPDGH